jgi:hypothetical protein
MPRLAVEIFGLYFFAVRFFTSPEALGWTPFG